MTWVGGIATYVIIWWTVIFAVLPFGVQPIASEHVSKGHAAGAPRHPRILLKAVLTSAISAILWVIVYWLFESGAFAFIDDVANS
jgi:predicted secreted protein